MVYEKYKTTKDIYATERFLIKAGSIVSIDWDGMDGAWWKFTDKKGETFQGCPWIDGENIKELTLFDIEIEQVKKLIRKECPQLKETLVLYGEKRVLEAIKEISKEVQ